jgi:hypothetical protein
VAVCNRFTPEENFSRKANPIPAIGVELRTSFDVFLNPSSSLDCVQTMSLEFEYRRLAAACLDLSKRSAALGDKTRLLLIAEAWLDLADRVARKNGTAKRRSDDSAELPWSTQPWAAASPPVPCSPRPQTRLGRTDGGMQ